MSFKPVKYVFSDFDGTLTEGHFIRQSFPEVLSFLESKSIPLIIVTGRPRTWGQYLTTNYESIPYVISEGGGTLSFRNDLGRLEEKILIAEEDVQRLALVTEELKSQFPDALFSVDNSGRLTDRAIELSWLQENPKAFEEIKLFLTEKKVNFSTSNVHLNFWCGEVSKAAAMKTLLDQLNTTEEEIVYFGDSLNDESVFKEFSHTVGVANISQVEDQLEFLPKVVMQGNNNIGAHGVLNYLVTLF